MHGSFVETAYRCAQAWVGLHDWVRVGSPHYYDHRVWEDQGNEVVVGNEDAVLVHQEKDFEVYEVRRSEAILSNLFRHLPVDPKQWYPQIDKRTVDKTFRFLVFLFGDRDEMDLRSNLGEPPVDGYLAGLFVLSDADRFLPVLLQWRGRQLDRVELSGRVEKAVSFAQNAIVEPKVPAPSLPPDILDGIVLARSGAMQRDRLERRRFVEGLLLLDRTSFLEALGRLLPWIEEGEAGWLDKDDEVSDRLWKILEEIPDMKAKMRLAPWKTGLGQPKSLRLKVNQDSTGPLSHFDRSIELTRTEYGPYRLVGSGR